LVAGCVFSVLVGALVLLLPTGPRRAPVVVAVAIVGVLLPSWLDSVVASPFTLSIDAAWVSEVARWLAPIVVGAAVAWSGVRTPGRIAAAVFAAVALWIGPALIT